MKYGGKYQKLPVFTSGLEKWGMGEKWRQTIEK